MDLERCGTSFAPDMDALTRELMTSKHRGGLIISPADNQNGFEVAEYAASEEDIKDSGVTVDDLWECTKEHYGLTAVTGLFSTVAIPIEKVKLGHRVHPGASKYTNITRHVGLKFFPRTNLKAGTAPANVAKRVFGTTRVFGIVGRAIPFLAVGIAVFDVISIGQCVYGKQK